jgi:Ribbon-helix-helix protein, copG family
MPKRTKRKVKRIVVLVRLDEETLLAVDVNCKSSGVNRSTWMRIAVANHLDRSRNEIGPLDIQPYTMVRST